MDFLVNSKFSVPHLFTLTQPLNNPTLVSITKLGAFPLS